MDNKMFCFQCEQAAHCTGCDIDPLAGEAAAANAALNGIGGDRLSTYTGNIIKDAALRGRLGGGYRLVLANIVADVIKALASTVRPLVREGGIFLCSGIIDDRAEEVLQKLKSDGWDVLEQRTSEGWYSFLSR